VGFEAEAHELLGRRCRRDMVQDGVRELPWDERGIVGLLAGKMKEMEVVCSCHLEVRKEFEHEAH
nr:hypothetical protein [Tanacetum cinerariifolium]